MNTATNEILDMHAFPEVYPAFAKVPRLNRGCVITEKLDGTNGLVAINDAGEIRAGSRNRWLTPASDNYGFAKWVEGNKAELIKLGPGKHYGEWWGAGIQRNYGLKEKRFSLFNVGRWTDAGLPGPGVIEDTTANSVECCYVVPVIGSGLFDTEWINGVATGLGVTGSCAAPGFRDPEGIVVYHEASGKIFKVTCKHDEAPKGVVNE